MDLFEDLSTLLQDQFRNPLVQTSALLAVGSYFLKPAVVSLGVLYINARRNKLKHFRGSSHVQ